MKPIQAAHELNLMHHIRTHLIDEIYDFNCKEQNLPSFIDNLQTFYKLTFRFNKCTKTSLVFFIFHFSLYFQNMLIMLKKYKKKYVLMWHITIDA